LLASLPRLDTPVAARLASIEGQPPRPGEERPGCAFASRCAGAFELCSTVAPQLRYAGARIAACHAPLADPGAAS